MKVITKMELQPDMVLGEDILDQDRVIYPAGTTITPQIIEKLKRYNLVCVTIMEDVDFAGAVRASKRVSSMSAHSFLHKPQHFEKPIALL